MGKKLEVVDLCWPNGDHTPSSWSRPKEKVCHMVLCKMETEQPTYCKKDKPGIVDCTCCEQCCTCGG